MEQARRVVFQSLSMGCAGAVLIILALSRGQPITVHDAATVVSIAVLSVAMAVLAGR